MITRRSSRLATTSVKSKYKDQTPCIQASESDLIEQKDSVEPNVNHEPKSSKEQKTTDPISKQTKKLEDRKDFNRKAKTVPKPPSKPTALIKVPKPPVKTTKNINEPKRKNVPECPASAAKKRKVTRDTIRFDYDHKDPVIEHLRQHKSRKVLNGYVNMSNDILDHIALEGLAGSTFGHLLSLLDATQPNSACLENQQMHHYIWTIIVKNYLNQPKEAGVQAFYSCHSKDKELAQDSNSSTNPEEDGAPILDKVIPLPHSTVKRFARGILSLHPVQHGPIMGSCSNYKARKDITKDIVDNYLQCPQDSIYWVQETYGLKNVHFVAAQHYRTKAILPDWADPNINIKLREYCTLELIAKSRTLGTVFPNDKTLGRYRLMLLAKGFITQYQLTHSCPIEHHLRRFSTNQADLSEWAKVKQMSLLSGASLDEDVADLGVDEDCDSKFPLSTWCCDPAKLKTDRGTLAMVYDVVAESNGMTQLDIRRKLNIPKFHLRNHLKNLISIRMLYSRENPDSTFRLFKTAHKCLRRKLRRRALRDESEKPTKIMASWDEADLRAKKIIGHKRSSFSQAEDSLLILCRITSILIDPASRLSWCVHKRLIRDLLHSELVESHDKTSDACLRRIKYLKRLPNNIMSINELTAELRDDADIIRLTQPDKPVESDFKLNKLFIQVLKTVRSKMPQLLGISVGPEEGLHSATTSASTTGLCGGARAVDGSRGTSRQAASESCASGAGGGASSAAAGEAARAPLAGSLEIRDYCELRKKYELVDCQSVASISRAPTYEQPKNIVDVKFNNVSLVTMAFTLSTCLAQEEASATRGQAEQQAVSGERANTSLQMDPPKGPTEPGAPLAMGGAANATSGDAVQLNAALHCKRAEQWLLDRFYSGYHDKLISSVLSKLNKRSLLTRKCPAEQASLYKPRTKMSLKLNQSVLFLLNRYQSSSLMQLARPISPAYQIKLSESNEMSSIALLTSFCAAREFQLDLRLRIPVKVVEIDQGNEKYRTLCERTEPSKVQALYKCGNLSDCLIVQPCNVEFYSDRKLEFAGEPLAAFVERAKSRDLPVIDGRSATEEAPPLGEALNQAPDGPHRVSGPDGDAGGRAPGPGPKQAAVPRPPNPREHEQGPPEQDEPAKLSERQESYEPALGPQQGSSQASEQQQQQRWRRQSLVAGHGRQGKQNSLAKWLVRGFRLEPSLGRQPATPSSAPAARRAPVHQSTPPSRPPHRQRRDGEPGAPQTAGSGGRWAPNAHQSNTSWLAGLEREFDANKVPVEFEARLWKRIDGGVDTLTLLKLMESLLSWIITFPGVELELLEREFSHLMPAEHLGELLDLMQACALIRPGGGAPAPRRKPRLFGYKHLSEPERELERARALTFESTASAYAEYCQLINSCRA